MPINIKNFKYGLDTRREDIAAGQGTLVALENAHINQGGEIEGRKAFVGVASYPTTFGIQETHAGIAVFGSVADPGVSAPFVYVRCQHPDGSTAMSEFIHSTSYRGLSFCITRFADGGVFSFYDGVLVDDLSPGRLESVLADGDALAAYIASLINDRGIGYTAVAVDETVTVTGPEGVSFGVTVENDSACETPLDTNPPDVTGETIVSVTMMVTVPAAASATGWDMRVDLNTYPGTILDTEIEIPSGESFTTANLVNVVPPGSIVKGSNIYVSVAKNGATPYHSEDWDYTLTVTYSNDATYIVSGTFNGYGPSAEHLVIDVNGPIAVEPVISLDRTQDGVTSFSGVIPQAMFQVTAVQAGQTGNVTSITANGLELIDTPVPLEDTPEEMAVAIATQINTDANQEIAATTNGATVILRATVAANYGVWDGKPVVVTVDDYICIGNGAIQFVRSSSINDPTCTSIKIDGEEIMSGSVAFATTMTAMVAAIAANIIAHTSDYTAVADGTTLYLSLRSTASSDGDKQIQVTGTYLYGVETTPGGSDSGASGGVFTGFIDIYPTNLHLYDIRGGPTVQVTVGSGYGPYAYAWELYQGDPTVYVENQYGFQPVGQLQAVAYASPVTSFGYSGLGSGSSARKKVDPTQWRCKITDSKGNIGYSAPVNVYYP